MKRFIMFLASQMLVSLLFVRMAGAQDFSGEAVQFAFGLEGSSYVCYERTDARRYDNGRYTGLVSREIKSQVNPIDPPKGAGFQNNIWFKGNFMVMEEMTSSTVKLRPFTSMMPTTFHISSNGTLTVVPGYNDDHTYRRDTGFPTFRSFPSYPAGEIHIGDSWTSTAYRSVDPLGTGIFTKLQIVVQYTYVGDETYKGTPCRKISAKWATRYGSGTLYHDYDGDPDLSGAQGTHNADIMVSVETGAAIVISDHFDETFTYSNGQTIRLAGTCTQFTEYFPAVDRSSVISELSKIASVDQESTPKSTADVLRERLGVSGTSTERETMESTSFMQGTTALTEESHADTNMFIEETDIGVRLSVRDIRFQADSARILGEESWRLDAVADVLKQMPGRLFLIEGHAAATGNEVGEQRLSEERAKAICDELIKRGISQDQLTYKGYGSSRPIADNSTSEGKAQNRRVEITILD